ncbi:MAG TPA: DNA repair and recombination protein RadB [archaeon]|nr:DNA repair and recombination protein RadB [archaeon]
MSDENVVRNKHLSSGSEKLDELLGGGFEHGIITQIYGGSGTGKTNICLQLTVECIKNREKVVIIDTDGFSAERFSQIAGDDAKKLANDLIIYEPVDFQQQYSAIVDIEKLASTGIGLVIIDSATLFYRFGLMPGDDNNANIRRQLVEQMAGLHRLARKFNMVVVITNQVYTDVETGDMHPLGGNLIEHLSKTIIKLEKIGKDKRKATLIKHRSRAEMKCADLTITNEGIV